MALSKPLPPQVLPLESLSGEEPVSDSLSLVLQFEVKRENASFRCGEAIVKLLTAQSEEALRAFDDHTDFAISFGIVECGKRREIDFKIRTWNAIQNTRQVLSKIPEVGLSPWFSKFQFCNTTHCVFW